MIITSKASLLSPLPCHFLSLLLFTNLSVSLSNLFLIFSIYLYSPISVNLSLPPLIQFSSGGLTLPFFMSSPPFPSFGHRHFKILQHHSLSLSPSFTLLLLLSLSHSLSMSLSLSLSLSPSLSLYVSISVCLLLSLAVSLRFSSDSPTATAALYSGSDHFALILSDTKARHSSVRSKDRVSIFSRNSGSSHRAFRVADILREKNRQEKRESAERVRQSMKECIQGRSCAKIKIK